MPINHADVQEFIRIGLAAIVALAYCGWQYNAIRLAMQAVKEEDEQ